MNAVVVLMLNTGYRAREKAMAEDDKERLIEMKLEWRRKKIWRHDGSFMLGEQRLYLVRNKNYLMFLFPLHVRELGKGLIELYRATRTPYGIQVLLTSTNHVEADKFVAKDGRTLIKITQVAGRFTSTLFLRLEEVPIVIRLLTECLKSETYRQYEKRWKAISDDAQRTHKDNYDVEREHKHLEREMVQQSRLLKRDRRIIAK